jgi:ornithine decarboxylase
MGLTQAQFVFRPKTLRKTISYFQKQFNAKILYAVKANPELHIIQQMYQQGVRSFDVASLHEIKKISNDCPGSELFYMHPVKPRHAIAESYFNYGVRHFSLDTLDELNKIAAETNHAQDLKLHVRLMIPNAYAELSLAEKFGVNVQEAPELLKAASNIAQEVGISFHVGSQCMHPDAYRIAFAMAKQVMTEAKININYFNVGGGFPSVYPGMHPPNIADYFEVIQHEFRQLEHSDEITLLAEPGRAMVAESTSLIVRVDLRKGDKLYINDGTYGSLFDAGSPKFVFPTRLIPADNRLVSNALIPFSFFGPTCDGLDFMPGPFFLSQDVEEGDYIEVGQMGAYGRCLASTFNGFRCADDIIDVADEPILSLYSNEDSYEYMYEINEPVIAEAV